MTLAGSGSEGGYRSGNDVIYQVGNDLEPLKLDMWMEPGTRIPTLHSHPQQREHFRVISGEFDVRVNKRFHRLGCGESITIDPGMMHGVGNASDGAAVVYTEIAPGLRTQEFFERLRRLEEERLDPVSMTLRYGYLVGQFRREYRYSPPVTLLFRLSGALGRLVFRSGPR